MRKNKDPYKLLMFAIVKQAYLDKDIRFFDSDWGQLLCEETDVRIMNYFWKENSK